MTVLERVRLSSQSSGICRIEMLQPELSLEMLNDLLLAFDKARQLNDVKAVVLAAHRVSSPSDHDLRLLLQKERLLGDYMDMGRALGRVMRDFRVPFGVCIARAAEGVGLELLLQAPSAVLGEEARVEWGLGHIPLLPLWGTLGLLFDRFGPAGAAQLLFRREALGSREAMARGLCRGIAPDLFLQEAAAWQAAQPASAKARRRLPSVAGRVLEPLWWARLRSSLPEEVRAVFKELLHAWASDRWEDAREEAVVRGYLLQEAVANRLLFAASRGAVLEESGGTEEEPAAPEALLMLGLLPPAHALARSALEKGMPLRIVDRDWQAMQKSLAGFPSGARFSASVRFSGFARHRMILEALSREEKEKQETLQHVGELVGGDSMVVTLLGAQPLKAVDRKYPHPGRLAGVHILESALASPVAEIVRGTRTSQETLKSAARLFRSLGCVPIIVNDRPAFLMLRLAAILANEVLMMMEEGISPLFAEEAFEALGFSKGPARLADEVGFKTLHEGVAALTASQKDLLVPSRLFPRVVEAGRYEKSFPPTLLLYKNGEPVRDNRKLAAHLGLKFPKDAEISLEEVGERLHYLLVNAAVRAVQDGVVDWEDKVDVAVEAVLGLPESRLGLLRNAEETGWGHVFGRLQNFTERFGPRYDPCRRLYELINEVPPGGSAGLAD
jgi:3-hydroxyacyl-CoA dehydrogenase / enoyl-CoA hydratase / 3-hydroxybutyryl-CoA epimerase